MLEFFKQNPNSIIVILLALAALYVYKIKLKNRQYEDDDEEQSVENEDSFEDFVASQMPSSEAVYFNFSGHAWDAYEVFGLTTDCTNTELEEAYMSALKQVDEPSREFVHMAYQAIQEKRG